MGSYSINFIFVNIFGCNLVTEGGWFGREINLGGGGHYICIWLGEYRVRGLSNFRNYNKETDFSRFA